MFRHGRKRYVIGDGSLTSHSIHLYFHSFLPSYYVTRNYYDRTKKSLVLNEIIHFTVPITQKYWFKKSLSVCILLLQNGRLVQGEVAMALSKLCHSLSVTAQDCKTSMCGAG